jgi:macrodomain Ter protein organizer (MatP/YcbG family)
MENKKTIILNGLDVVTNRKMISIKLPVWKKLISCSRHEDITITKLIDKLLTSLIDYNFNTQDQIEYK